MNKMLHIGRHKNNGSGRRTCAGTGAVWLLAAVLGAGSIAVPLQSLAPVCVEAYEGAPQEDIVLDDGSVVFTVETDENAGIMLADGEEADQTDAGGEEAAGNAQVSAYREVIDGLLAWAKKENGMEQDAALLSGTFLQKAGTTAGDWYALGLGRFGLTEEGLTNYLSALTIYVQNHYKESGILDENKATEWHRIALTLLSLGGNPASIAGDSDSDKSTINLIADGTWNYEALTGKTLDAQGINAWIWALLALDAMDYEIPEGQTLSRAQILEQIAGAANADGGYSLSGGESDPDVTAMVVQALAPYYVDEETGYQETEVAGKTVTQIVDNALAYLSASQQPDGDFMAWGDGTSESVSQVIIALTSLGIDPLTDERFIKDGKTLYDGLMKYRQEDGGFAHSVSTEATSGSNSMAGGQALCALAALVRQANGYSSLYDCTDPQNAEAGNGYVVNVFDGTSAQAADSNLFTEADQAAFEALPDHITTDYAGEVARLKEKLQAAENKKDYKATLLGLEYYEAQIESAQESIDTINQWIEDNIYDEEGYDNVNMADLLQMVDEANALRGYDKEQIKGYDDLLKAEKEISSEHRAKIFRLLIILAIVLIVVSVLLDRRHRKKMEKQRNA